MNCWCQCDEHHPKLATVIWTSTAGNEIPLCDSCCAGWRENAVTEPDLGPVRIRSAA